MLAQGAAAAPGAPSDTGAALTQTFNQAMSAFQQGDYNTAATNLQSVISQAGPGSQLEPVYFTLGAAYFNLGQYDKAVDTLKLYLEKYPQSARAADATFSMGQASLLNKDSTTAAAAFARLENVPKYREQALLYEGMADKDAGNTDEAVAALEKLISPEIDTTVKVDGAMFLAGLYNDQKKPDKAQALVGKIFEKSDMVDNAVRLNSLAASLGDKLLEDDHPAEAIATYRRVRSRDEVIKFQAERVSALQGQLAQNVAAMRANPAQAANYMAQNSFLNSEIMKAKGLYDQATKLPEYGSGLLLREGRAWYDENKKWESIVVFSRLMEKYPAAKERESALFSLLTAYADVNEPAQSRKYCEQYLKEFPTAKGAETVAYLLGATALQSNDLQGAESYFGRAIRDQPNSTYREQMEFMLGNAKFGEGKFDDSITQYQKYLGDFPTGQYAEEATYRIATALVFGGKFEEAMKSINDYLQRYPQGDFRADAKYRLMVCSYAGQDYDQVIAGTASWQSEFPDNEMTGEVLSLDADALAAKGKVEEAIPVYVESYKKAATDEVMNYSLFEAAKNMQKLGKWEDVSNLFQEFVKTKPDSPSVVAAMYWIGKALSHLGKSDQAKAFLVDQLKTYIGDPKREAVEQLLQQLAQLCAHRPRPAPAASPAAEGAASPGPGTQTVASTGTGGGQLAAASPPPDAATPPSYDAVAELDKQLGPLKENANAPARARLIFAHAELATLLRKPAEHDQLIGQIAGGYTPDELSPLLLAQGGDWLLAAGKPERAADFYSELKEYFPNSIYLDYAYVGLGEIAFAKKDYPDALQLFTDAVDKVAGSKMKEATIGEAKTLLEQGHYDEARKLYEQIATVREWRGESTAYAVYSMGDIEARQGHWAEAIAYFQRVFVLYQRYLPWVAKAYISSAKSFDKLGKRQEAIDHLHEMLRNEKLQNMPEATEAKQMLTEWGAPA